MEQSQQMPLAGFLCVAALISASFKLINIFAGAPFVTIDDQTMYEGGFLVWFGHVPPQRMYLESWVSGIVSLATYVWQLLSSGNTALLGSNLVADAYQNYFINHDPYVHAYRVFAFAADMSVAALVLLFVREVAKTVRAGAWLMYLVPSFYLLSFNTLWSDLAARPDTLTALFAALGLFLYFRSRIGEREPLLYYSAAAFGLATGMKLHGAFFVVFAVIDLLRLWGFAAGLKKIIPFGIIAVVMFLLAAGSPLFDPLLFVKLRYLNIVDDASPWIKWGDQFQVVLYGTGWLCIPLLVFGAWSAFRNGDWRNRTVSSVFMLSLLWLLLFCSIRQLRSYWMLPVLPLFYAGAVYGLCQLRQVSLRAAVAAVLIGIMIFQCYQQMSAFRSTNYNALRSWIKTNVKQEEPFYVLGFVDIGLPRNAVAIDNKQRALEHKLAKTKTDGESFTMRHIRLWEERSDLELMDMLRLPPAVGYEYYTYFEAELADYRGVVNFDDFRYLILQEHFSLTTEPQLQQMLARQFEQVAVVTGPGGHSNGLTYQIFKRK